MQALTFHGVRDVRVEDVDEPVLRDPGDALVAVTLAGVCGSDLHQYHGREGRLDPGTVMGHEIVGRIVAVGEGVTRRAVGERVISAFTVNCGACFFCTSGLTARCVHAQLLGDVRSGRGLQGGQAALVRVPFADTTLAVVPDDIEDSLALLCCDVLPTGFHAANIARVREGSVAVVIGAGPVGLMAVLAAKHRGAREVIAVDAVPERLALARRLGAVAVAAEESAARAAVNAVSEGRGADSILECVGSAAAGQLAFELVRVGGAIGAVGVHHESHFAFSPGQAYDKNLSYRAGRCSARRWIDEILPLVKALPEEVSEVFSHTMPLADGPRAYDIFDRKVDGCIKVALAP